MGLRASVCTEREEEIWHVTEALNLVHASHSFRDLIEIKVVLLQYKQAPAACTFR